jgi:hypothetical protein
VWSGDLPSAYTTGKRLALFPASRFYRTGYSVLLSLLPSLTPFQGKRSALGFSYSIVNVLLFYNLIIQQKHIKKNLKT